MKFAHLADTHLGYRQYGLFEREKDFYEVFEKVIDKIIEGSIAEELEIEAGDELVAINDQEIEDIFDYQYYVEDEYIEVFVRKPDGELVIDTEEFHGVMHGNKIKNLPFIRGIFNFVDSLILGTRTLTYSADFVEDETAKETAMDHWFKKVFKDK